MVALTRLNGQQFVLNSDQIESIESTPDTHITMMNGKRYMVQNSIEDVVRKAVKYRQLCGQAPAVVDKRPGAVAGKQGT